MNQTQLAKAFKISPRTVENWVKRGCPRSPDKRFDLTAVIKWKLENDLPRKVTLPSKSESDRLKAYYESQLNKIEVEKASDVLMKTETHIQQMSGAILSVRNSLLCVSATMTSLFRAHAGEAWRILADTLQTEMERSLNLFADEVETDD